MSIRQHRSAAPREPNVFDAPRRYLFVSSRDPLAAAAAVWSWPEGPPDLCVTSPSPEAQDTAGFASAGHLITIIGEPMLERRRATESWDDFKARFAEGLLIVSAYDTRAALVVCDQFPDEWPTPFVVDGESILRRADLLRSEVPLP